MIAEGTSDELKDRVGGERLEVHLESAADASAAARALGSMGDESPQVEDGTVRVTIRRRTGAIVEVPVFLSGGPQHVPVEMQFRTVAMDFWATLEHKIYYKYDRDVPAALLDELREAADTAAHLDARMQRLHRAVHGDDEVPTLGQEVAAGLRARTDSTSTAPSDSSEARTIPASIRRRSPSPEVLPDMGRA